MRCDDCLPLLEEYVYGELEGPAAGRVSAHLTVCAACAGERDLLARERRLYARCVVAAPQTLRAAVLQRIGEEKASGAFAPAARPRAWLKSGFGFWRPRWAFAAGLSLIAIMSWALFKTSRPGADVPLTNSVASSNGGASVSGGAPTTSTPLPDAVPTPVRQTVDGSREVTNKGDGRAAGGRSVVAAAVARRAPRKASTREAHASAASGVAPAPNAPVYARADEHRLAPAAAEVIRDETSRHFERAQMLLRSFKNGQLSGGEAGLDLAYERRLSRTLLGRNILLRGEAQADGDEAAARLLGQLEPFLLDIANLNEEAAPEQVRSIRERMEREGIVARLRLF